MTPPSSSLRGSTRGERAGRVHAPNQRESVLPASPPCPPITDIPGAADYLATTERHVRQMVFERRIPFTRLGNGPRARVRFYYSDLDKWLTSTRVEAQR